MQIKSKRGKNLKREKSKPKPYFIVTNYKHRLMGIDFQEIILETYYSVKLDKPYVSTIISKMKHEQCKIRGARYYRKSKNWNTQMSDTFDFV